MGKISKPLMLSSLSNVPPVCPKPRPAIMGTKPPQAASMGASISDTTSPTPPVECLSSVGALRLYLSQFKLSPLSRMARVKAVRSSRFKSLK